MRRKTAAPAVFDHWQKAADLRPEWLEIGLATGFANQSHFTTAFRRLVGMTPKRYRDQV